MRWSEARTKLGNALPGTFGLRVYGESLMTSGVRTWMNSFGVILLVQMMFDVWAWDRAFSYGLHNMPWYGLPLALAVGLATVILLFDRAVITADTSASKWAMWSLFGRFVVLCLIAGLTAIPVELSIFESEIDQRFDHEEKIKLDALRTTAIDAEQAKYDATPSGLIAEAQIKYDGDGTPAKPGLIAEAKGRVAPGATQARTDAEQALEVYKTKRETDRHAKVGPLEEEVARLKAEVAAQQNRYDGETTGKGGTRRYGVGSVARDQMTQLRKLQGDLTTAQNTLTAMQNSPDLQAFDRETTTEIARLQAAIGGNAAKVQGEADGKVADLITERDTEVARLRKERDDKVDALRIMDGEELANTRGGEWKMSRGFMDRLRELDEITDEDPTSSWVVWGCRLVMILIGLIILILKLLAKGDFADYYSRNLQMAHGEDPELLKVARAKGYTDDAVRKALGYDYRTKDQLHALLLARIAYGAAYRLWLQFLQSICVPADVTGLCLSRQEVKTRLKAKWQEVMEPKGEEVAKAEAKLREIAIPVPVWPEILGPNPGALIRPWDPSSDELIGAGWKDPAPIREAIQDALDDLLGHRQTFEAVVLKHFVAPIVAAIAANSRITRTRLVEMLGPPRIRVYNAPLAPLLTEIWRLEDFLIAKGETVPTWDASFQHPTTRNELKRIWRFPTATELVDQFGWRGQEDDRERVALPTRRPIVLPDDLDEPVPPPPPGPVPDPAPPVVASTPAEPVVIAAPPALTTSGNGHDQAAADALAAAAAAVAAPATPPTLPAMEDCAACNQPTPVGSDFCVSCGIDRRQPAVAAAPVVVPPPLPVAAPAATP